MAAGGSRYYQPTQIRRQDPNAVQRGMQVGSEIGKLLGSLGTAIQGYQKDQLANKLMTDQDIANQPGAGQTQDLGTLPGDGGAGSGAASDDDLQKAMAASQLSSSSQPAQDLGQLPSDNAPQPTLGINPDIVPSSTASTPTAADDASFQQAMAAAKLGSGPTVGSVSPPGGPQPAAQPAAQPSSGGDFNLSGFSGGSGKGTVGGLTHTGGVQEMELQEKMQQMQAQKAANLLTQQEGALRLADARAKASGTGQYALSAALQRAQLAAAQRKALNPDKPVDLNKNPPPAANLDTEPVLNQTQLEQTVDGAYDKGTYGGLMRTINQPEMIDDPKAPIDPKTGKAAIDPKTGMAPQIPNPDGPLISGNSITLGPKNKRVTMTLQHAQILAKQQNSINFKKGLPLIRVPGEDQTQGSQENPYPIQNKLDMVSRAHGTWVRLPPSAQFPNGQIKQVP